MSIFHAKDRTQEYTQNDDDQDGQPYEASAVPAIALVCHGLFCVRLLAYRAAASIWRSGFQSSTAPSPRSRNGECPAALKEEGFSVLGDIDGQATLTANLGADDPAVTVSGRIDEIRVSVRTSKGTRFFQSPSAACRPVAGVPIQEQVVTAYKDQIQGRMKEVQGKIKEAAGKLVGNKELQAKGKAQKTRGKAQAKFGDVKQKLKVAKKKVAKKKVAKKKAAAKK